MAVEIKELIIRAVVDYEQSETQREEVSEHAQPDEQKIIQACIKQVLKILKQKQER